MYIETTTFGLIHLRQFYQQQHQHDAQGSSADPESGKK